jgi:hypothetical protein
MKEILKKGLKITMPDGSNWIVPIQIIADHRAKYYAEHDGISFDESLNNDTIPLFEDDTYNIHDWAANNMNWKDVKDHAVKCKDDKEVDFEDGWMNGEYELVSFQ